MKEAWKKCLLVHSKQSSMLTQGRLSKWVFERSIRSGYMRRKRRIFQKERTAWAKKVEKKMNQNVWWVVERMKPKPEGKSWPDLRPQSLCYRNGLIYHLLVEHLPCARQWGYSDKLVMILSYKFCSKVKDRQWAHKEKYIIMMFSGAKRSHLREQLN